MSKTYLKKYRSHPGAITLKLRATLDFFHSGSYKKILSVRS